MLFCCRCGSKKKTVASHGSFVFCILLLQQSQPQGERCVNSNPSVTPVSGSPLSALSLLSSSDYNAGQVITQSGLGLFVLLSPPSSPTLGMMQASFNCANFRTTHPAELWGWKLNTPRLMWNQQDDGIWLYDIWCGLGFKRPCVLGAGRLLEISFLI